MIERFRAYTEVKDSGAKWFGYVPANWTCVPLVAVASPRSVANCPDRELLSVYLNRGVVRFSDVAEKRTNATSSDLSKYQVVDPGDFVLNNQQAWRGSVGVSPHAGIVSPAYLVLSLSPSLYPQYANYLFRDKAMVSQYLVCSKGVGSIQRNLYWPHLKRVTTIVPPIDEQKAIARYLHATDRNITRFIRNRRRLIEVLNEQKQAIINRAVTRGLDPNAPLKPSGIDWLGNIPEHWETRRLRTVADLRVSNVDKHTKEGEVPVRLCNYTDVYKNTVVTANMPFMAATATRDEIEAFRLRIGDVVITKDSEDWQDIGVPALVAETADDLVCGYHLAILRPRPNVAVGRFLSYALQCRGVVAQLNLAAKGVTRYGLSHGAIKAIALPVPPVEKQEPIARHIDEATASLNGAISRATREIDLIREYRTRLIADVVTGKVDVRHLAPPTGSEDLEETIDELEPLDDAAGELEDEALAGEVAHADD